MTLLIDPAVTEGHGRRWSHLASDTSFEELHAFARALGVPERGFDRDHYDVPAEFYDNALAAGAVPVSSRELVARLHATGLRRPKGRTLAPRRPGRALLRPPRLRPGELVAVLSPAGPAAPERLAAGVEVLERWGLRVRTYAEQTTGVGWLAGPDRIRAEQLTDACTDPKVRAVWTTRGGYGTQRLLDLLDWDAIAASTPRLLVGFSDITALHQAFAHRLGVATVHASGVAGLGDGDHATNEILRGVVMEGHGVELTGQSVRCGGRPEGVLLGGNLTLLATSVGTRLVHPAKDAIVLLEDVAEQPYRLDRSLTQLIRSGWLDGVRGVALGRFTACGDPVEVAAVLEERLAPLQIPVISGLPVGHEVPNLPVPLGVLARLDADAGTLSIGPAVR